MNKKQNDREIDENFFREMNYELAGDIGAVDHEDMMHNKKLLMENNPKDENKVKLHSDGVLTPPEC